MPQTFQVLFNGFPVNYWTNVICHNYIVWIDLSKITQQLEVVQSDDELARHHNSFRSENYRDDIISTSFSWNGIVYTIDNCLVDDDIDGYFYRRMTPNIFTGIIVKGGIVPVEMDRDDAQARHHNSFRSENYRDMDHVFHFCK